MGGAFKDPTPETRGLTYWKFGAVTLVDDIRRHFRDYLEDILATILKACLNTERMDGLV